MRYAGTFENIYDSKEVQIKFRQKQILLVVLKNILLQNSFELTVQLFTNVFQVIVLTL